MSILLELGEDPNAALDGKVSLLESFTFLVSHYPTIWIKVELLALGMAIEVLRRNGKGR